MSFDIEKPNLKDIQVNTNSINVDDIWKSATEAIRLYISKREFDSWFKGVYLEKIENGIAELSTDQAYKREWIESYHRAMVKKVLENITGIKYEIVITLRTSNKQKIKGVDESTGTISLFQLPVKGEDKEGRVRNAQLNPKYLFSNFIVGAHNKLAHAVAEAIVDDPGKAYNPVFFYGPTGVGKTHLMQSIGNEFLDRYPNKKAVYASSEQFLNEMIEAIRKKTNDVFRKKYRDIDLLIIDDVQFVETYEKTQTELFNTFNTLYLANKQIILAADRPPKEIKNLTDRLRSRFEGGMVADIQAPDFETRIAILRSITEEKGITIDREILELVAKNIESNVRELEGAITKIISMTKLGHDSSLDDVARMLQFDIDSRRKRIRPERVIGVVCEIFDVTQKEIKGNSRTAYLALARQVVMYILRSELELPLEKIAREVNRKDHTTVIHACEKISLLIKNDKRFSERYDKCKALLA